MNTETPDNENSRDDARRDAELAEQGHRALVENRFEEAVEVLLDLHERHPGEPRVSYNLALALYGLERHDEALDKLEKSLQHDATNITAWLYRGVLLEGQDRFDDAEASFLRAIRTADRFGAKPSDENMQRLMDHALASAAVAMDRQFSEVLAPLSDRHGEHAIARIRAGADRFTGKKGAEPADPDQRPNFFYVPDLESKSSYPREAFAWAGELEAAVDTIRTEFGMPPDGDAPQETALYRNGQRQPDAERYPLTVAAVESVADLHRVDGYSPQVSFLVLPAGARVEPRHGASNGRLTVHLPLAVPGQGAELELGRDRHAWQVGRALVYDDTFLHAMHNDGDGPLVLLSFDVWNPQLAGPERDAYAAVLQAAQRFEQRALAPI